VVKNVGGAVTYYLVDDRNPSGYAQVVEEITAYAGTTNLTKVYAYGLDLISQQQPGVATNYYGHDGHGSVRYLTSTSGDITDTYTYDAYGNLIASSGSTANNYLYCGEQYDPQLKFYYNRARYLNPDTGRFWTMDTFAGNNEDPLSLHKYLYCQADPVDNTDSSGQFVAIYTTIGHSLNVLTGKTTGRIIYVQTAKGFINQIKALPDGSIKEIDFIGHGNSCVQGISADPAPKEGISITPMYSDWKPRILGDSIHNVPVLLADVLNGKMVTDGVILLEGCHVAAVNYYDASAPNICQAVSIAVLNAYVSGSTKTTYGPNDSPEGHDAWWGSMRTYHSSPTVTISPSSLNVMENFGMGLP
jgi:RHS repeat-associated protein